MKRFALGMVFLFGTFPAVGQGCSQCRDNVEQTPPQVRSAYRHAIELMAGSAAFLFGGVILFASRLR